MQRDPGENTIALIGDSHSQHLYAGLISRTKEGVAVFPASGAVPLIGLHSMPKTRPYTDHLISEGFIYILSHRNITKVVLSHHPCVSWHDVVDNRNPDNHDFNSILHDGFARTYDALTKAGKEIYVVLDNPLYNKSWSKCKASAVSRPVAVPDFLSLKNEKMCSVKQSEREDREKIENWSRIAHETAAGYKNIHFIDLAEMFCENGTCSMLDQKGNLLYQDTNHLNIKGSLYVAPFVLDKLRK